MTDVFDKDGNELRAGDKVELLGMTGTVVVECGALGIAFESGVDWNAIEAAIKPTTGCDNGLMACCNDHFVSLWELARNFCAEDNVIPNLTRLPGTNS